MPYPSKTKLMRSSTARILAACFLFLGIIIGTFDAPQYVNKILEKAGIGFRLPAIYFPFRLGLDIRGGTHLVYQADTSNVPKGEEDVSAEALRDVIERRVNLFSVAEPVVQTERRGEERRLIVELAGVQDIGEAIKLIGLTPLLEFREERSQEEREEILKAQENKERLWEDPYFALTPLTGKYLKRSELLFDQTTLKPQIGLELNEDGAKIFADLTKRNKGKRLAIYLDGAPISAPVVQEEITGGKAQITGDFTPQEAKELVGRLNSGALPLPIKLISQQSVGPSLGQESLQKSLRAGLLGFLAVALFMIFWYRLPGIIAVLALLFYTAVVLAIFKLIPVTLTVAGIAGFILSMGMAVDANILIFERMKEELRSARSLREAIDTGFTRAWSSIRDSNVTSLITSAILYGFGSSLIQGFALTLSIGILVSMFSAITITRIFLMAVVIRRLELLRFIFLSGFSK